ncbi:MAG: hypothetical protein DLM58_09115 [Pseudonocardiales bacterium]|nr:MAG: hypothetical protein DLM58_09115 [Pseudonocardiales bacterium]
MAKVMISMPDDLLAAVDAAVARRSTSRSAFLAEAARLELRRPDPGAIAAAIERSEARFADAGPFDAADLIRAERDAHR